MFRLIFRAFGFEICSFLMIACAFLAIILEPSWSCILGWITASALFVRLDMQEGFNDWLVKKLKRTEEVVLTNGLSLPSMDEPNPFEDK